MGNKTEVLDKIKKSKIDNRQNGVISNLQNIETFIDRKNTRIEKIQKEIVELNQLADDVIKAFEADDDKALKVLSDKVWELHRADSRAID